MERAALIALGRRGAAVAAALACCAAPLIAQERWPALMDVTGVSEDDALNLRDQPWAHARIVGALATDATGVEVIGTDLDGGWGRVALAEGEAWASLDFLARQPGQIPGALPLPATCSGTEPFWTLDVTGAAPQAPLTLSEPGNAPEEGRIAAAVSADGRNDRFAVTGRAGDAELTATLRLAACTDGMSDRPYGIAIDLVLPGPRLLSGCCSLTSLPAASD